MKKLIAQIDKAVVELQKGAFTGNVITLLNHASLELKAKQLERHKIADYNAQAAWQSHQKFTERLSAILSRKIEVEDLQPGERLMWCYVTDFYATPASRRAEDDREATVTIRHADIRISTDESIAPPHSRLQYSDRYGCEYREPRCDMWTFPERWLWDDDWEAQFKRRSLQIRLARARNDCKRAIAHRDEVLAKKVPAAHSRVIEMTDECEKIVQEMLALDMKIPKEVKHG